MDSTGDDSAPSKQEDNGFSEHGPLASINPDNVKNMNMLISK